MQQGNPNSFGQMQYNQQPMQQMQPGMGMGAGMGVPPSGGMGMGAPGMGMGMGMGPGVGMGQGPPVVNVQQQQQMGQRQQPMGMGVIGGGQRDPLEDILGPFPCVRIRGLPFEATMEDVIMFFQGLVVLDVVLAVRGDGRGSGEAFVVFSNPMDCQMALQRDRQNMGRRYIEVFQAKRGDYYQAISAAAPLPTAGGPGGMGGYQGGGGGGGPRGAPAGQLSEHTGILRLRGLPFSASKADVLHFFDGYEIVEDSIEFVVRADGRVTGESYVQFTSPDAAKAAMARDRNVIGSRYVELFISTPDEYQRVTGRQLG